MHDPTSKTQATFTTPVYAQWYVFGAPPPFRKWLFLQLWSKPTPPVLFFLSSDRELTKGLFITLMPTDYSNRPAWSACRAVTRRGLFLGSYVCSSLGISGVIPWISFYWQFKLHLLYLMLIIWEIICFGGKKKKENTSECVLKLYWDIGARTTLRNIS